MQTKKTMITIPQELIPIWDNLFNKSMLIRKALIDCASDPELNKYYFKNLDVVQEALKKFQKIDSGNKTKKS